MNLLSGNVQGLSAGQKKLLDRIYRRRVDPSKIVTSELAAFLCECSREIRRQVGILIDRAGNIIHVIVGDAHQLYMPDLGPRRAGQSRFRGLRLVHTHLRGETLTRDDLVDLAKLRLDLVAAIQMKPDGQQGPMVAAHLLPPNAAQEPWRILPPISVREIERDTETVRFDEFIEALEEEFAAEAQLRVTKAKGDQAILVHVALGRDPNGPEAEERIDELKELCRTAGVQVLHVMRQRRNQLDPKSAIGKGKLEELVTLAMQFDATILIFDHDLNPAQAKTISDATELKVIDRTMLILDIFAQHAGSRDGKIQVELAQLKYTLPRLQERNTMMSRLTGGIGGRGPGETKLEIDRRRAREKIHLYETQIAELGNRRKQRRSLRTKNRLPIVAIVGYTNAGKSTLLNTLTKGDVIAENKLFATLDPASRRLRFPNEREIILTDTVGFIRELPKDLIAAFRATLEELEEADLLLHVIDAGARPEVRHAHIRAVEAILRELELEKKPRLLIWNKIDRLSETELADLLQQSGTEHEFFALSALQPQTTKPLLAAMERILWEENRLLDGLTNSAEPGEPATYEESREE